jgi:FAD:protein FMN transferase
MTRCPNDESGADGFDMRRFEQFTFWAMGTENVVQVLGPPERIDGVPLGAWCAQEVERYEQCWSRFRPDSELNRSMAQPGRQYGLSEALLVALDCAARAFFATGGLFDARIRTCLNVLGYSKPFRELPLDPFGRRIGLPTSTGLFLSTRSEMLTTGPGFTLDLRERWASFEAGTQLDLGGVGKGLAADLLATALVGAGALGACVSLGGDIRTVGIGPQKGGWEIPLPHPMFDDREFTTQRCVNAAMVMSTVGLRRWHEQHEQHEHHDPGSPTSRGHQPQSATGLEDSVTMLHHLIDPRTQQPTRNGVHSVAAFGAQAWWAEVGAKAALIAGPEQAVALLERLGLDGWVFLTNGTVATTALIDQNQLQPVSC